MLRGPGLEDYEMRGLEEAGIAAALAIDIAITDGVDVDDVEVRRVYDEIDADGNQAIRADLAVQNGHVKERPIWFYDGCDHGLSGEQLTRVVRLAKSRWVVDRRPRPVTDESSVWLG